MSQFFATLALWAIGLWVLVFLRNWMESPRDAAGAALWATITVPITIVLIALVVGVVWGIGWLFSVALG